jgi:hypothetical protein
MLGMDFFSSDAFLTALAREYYRAKNFEIKTYGIGEHRVRLVEINGKKPAVNGPFYDYVKPLSSPAPTARTVRFIPKLVTRTVALDDREPRDDVPISVQDPAPLIIWDRFATWEDYLSFVKRRSANLLLKKRYLKLVREYGEPDFEFDDRNPEAFEKCILWKLNQYDGGNETLSNPRAVAMLRSLFDDGHLIISTLKIGGQYLSAHACAREPKCHLSLIPSYDQGFAKYGIGKELLHRMLEHSYRHGDEAFDFLQGGEPYKWNYATHLQILEAVGQPTLAHQIKVGSRQLAKEGIIKLSPALFLRLKALVLAARRLGPGLHRA